jgi:hypothetical protein
MGKKKPTRKDRETQQRHFREMKRAKEIRNGVPARALTEAERTSAVERFRATTIERFLDAELPQGANPSPSVRRDRLRAAEELTARAGGESCGKCGQACTFEGGKTSCCGHHVLWIRASAVSLRASSPVQGEIPDSCIPY